MTNDDNPDTYEHWTGPVRSVISVGGRKIPLAPPLPGETEPFAWVSEPSAVLSMDVDGRPVESATLRVRDGRGELLVKFKDGGEATYDHGRIRSTHDHA